MGIEKVSDKGKTKVQDTIKRKDFTRRNSERLELDHTRKFLPGGSGEGSSKDNQNDGSLQRNKLEKEKKEIQDEYKRILETLKNNFEEEKINESEYQNALNDEFYAYKEKMDAWREEWKNLEE